MCILVTTNSYSCMRLTQQIYPTYTYNVVQSFFCPLVSIVIPNLVAAHHSTSVIEGSHTYILFKNILVTKSL